MELKTFRVRNVGYAKERPVGLPPKKRRGEAFLEDSLLEKDYVMFAYFAY